MNESGITPNETQVKHRSEFYKRSTMLWLYENGTEMYSTNNKGTFINAERIIRALKNKIYKHMTAVSKNVCTNKLDETVDKYNKTHHRTINMKPADLQSATYTKYCAEYNNKDPEFKVGDRVEISKYQNIFVKSYLPN